MTTVNEASVTAPKGKSPKSSKSADRGKVWATRVVLVALCALCIFLIFGPFVPEVIGVAAIVLGIILIFLRVPVAISLSVTGLMGLYSLYGERALESAFGSVPYSATASWQMSVIPMFVLMAMLLDKSGVASQAYISARQWLGFLPGGLGVGTNVAGTGMSALSGSTVGSTYAISRVAIPEMLKAGYHPRLAVGAVIVSGLPGQLIPPSILLMIYAGMAETPIGPQLIAGIAPGLMISLMYSLVIIGIGMARPSLTGRDKLIAREKFPLKEKIRGVLIIWPLPVLIFAIVGGIYSGIMTATEAGAVAALIGVALTLWYQRKNKPFAKLLKGAVDAALAVGSIFFVLLGAHIVAQLLAVTGVADGLAEFVTDMQLGRVPFLILIIIMYVILGAFMDDLALMLITVPLLIPALQALDISLIWFGVFVVLITAVGMLTPPMGIMSFIVHKIVQDPEVNLGRHISLGDVFIAVLLFLPVVIPILVLLIAFPEIATFLPDRM